MKRGKRVQCEGIGLGEGMIIEVANISRSSQKETCISR